MQHNKTLPLVTLVTMFLICALAIGGCDWFASAPAPPCPDPCPAVVCPDPCSDVSPWPVPFGDANPAGITTFNNLAAGDLALTDDLTVADDTTLTGDLNVDGAADFDSTMSIAGDTELIGTTPTFTIGDAGEEDAGIVFDGAAQDFYCALDDTADDLVCGLGSAVGTTGILFFDENQDLGVGSASAGAKLQVTGNVLVDGAADEIQVTIQGNGTQTSVLQTWEQSNGDDVGTMTNAGALDILGLLTYSADDRTPYGFDGATGYEIYFGSTDTVTQTTIAAGTHNMATAVDWGICFVSDPDADAGDPFLCTISIDGTNITFQALDDDGDNAATAATTIYYLIVGR